MFELRVADISDARFLFDLRNQESNRKMFKDTSLVQWEDHVSWLTRKLKEEFFVIYIGFKDERPVGQFRIDANGDVSVSLSDEFKGQGLGTVLIKEGSLLYRSQNPKELVAIVKEENQGSSKVFEKAGYFYKETFNENGQVYKKYTF